MQLQYLENGIFRSLSYFESMMVCPSYRRCTSASMSQYVRVLPFSNACSTKRAHFSGPIK